MTKKAVSHDLKDKLQIEYVDISTLKESEYNPRVWSDDAKKQLKESLKRFGCVDPLILNSAPGRENVVIGGNFRLFTLKELGFKTVPVVYLHIADIEKEKELNIRLNKNTGAFDWDLLKNFSEDFLDDIGFTSQELDNIFDFEENIEEFDLAKELKKLDIENIEIEKGSVYELGEHRLMCGDSTVESDMIKLMDGEKVTFCCTDPPYLLDYLSGKQKHGKATTGFGYKRDRRYGARLFSRPSRGEGADVRGQFAVAQKSNLPINSMLDDGDIKAYREVCLKITGTAPEGEQAREEAERVVALVRAVYETEQENRKRGTREETVPLRPDRIGAPLRGREYR